MTRRAYHLTFMLFAAITVVSLVTAAYSYGKNSVKVPVGNAPADAKTKVLLGRIVRIEPLHVYVESGSLGPSRTYDVLISPQTQYLQLSPWAPGEREQAQKERKANLENVRPTPGVPVPAPTPSMKPVRIDPKALVPGASIGVLATQTIDHAQPIIASVIRPLTPQEADTMQVDITFPL